MKKTLSLLLALVLVLGLAIPALAGDVTEITYWYPHSGLDQQSLIKSVEEFNAANPDIHVNAEFIGGSGSGQGITDKLTVAINGGTPPDVVLFDRFMVAQWANGGLFEDLTDYAEKYGVTKDKFYDFAWNEASYKGRLYAFPFDTDVRALYYNKTLLEAAGFTEPPKTTDDLMTYAKALTKKQGNRFEVIGFAPWLNQGWLYTWGWAFGGQFQGPDGRITANDPKIVEALTWEKTFADEFNIESVADFNNAAQGSDMNIFAAEMVAMVVSGPWEIASYRDQNPDLKFGVAPIPTPTGTNNNSWAGGWSHVVPKGSAHPEAAAKFAAFMTVGQGAINYGEETTHFLSCKELNSNLSFAKGDPDFQVFLDIFPTAYSRPPIPAGQLLWDELVTATDNALYGRGEPQALLDGVTEKLNAELDKLAAQ